jgi:hypothetical protein
MYNHPAIRPVQNLLKKIKIKKNITCCVLQRKTFSSTTRRSSMMAANCAGFGS